MEENLNPPEINDDNNIVEVDQVDEIPEIDDGTLDGAVEDIGQLCSDQTCVQGLVEVVDTAMNSEEGLDETSISLIKSSVENIYNRHGIPRRYRTKLPALETFSKGDKYAFNKDLKVSLEGILGDTWKGIKAAWKAICDFFYGIWKAIFGGGASKTEEKTNKAAAVVKEAKNKGIKDIKVTKEEFLKILKAFDMYVECGAFEPQTLAHLIKNPSDAPKIMKECLNKGIEKLIGNNKLIKSFVDLLIEIQIKCAGTASPEDYKKILSENSKIMSTMGDMFKTIEAELKKENITEEDFKKFFNDELDKEKGDKIIKILNFNPKEFEDEKVVSKKSVEALAEKVEKMSDDEFDATFNLFVIEEYISLQKDALKILKETEKNAKEAEAALKKMAQKPVPDKNLAAVTKSTLAGNAKLSKNTLDLMNCSIDEMTREVERVCKLDQGEINKQVEQVRQQLKDPNIDTVEI